MDKKELMRQFLAGIFFFVGIFLIVMFIFFLGRDKGLAQAKFQVVVLYRHVGGLMEGAPVRLAGVNVGSVDNIDFLKQEVDSRRVKVTLNIFSRYKEQLQKDLKFAVKTEGILGEKLVEIDVLAETPKADLTRPVIGEDPIDVQDLAEVFGEAAESFTRTAEQLNKIDVLGLTEVMGETSQSLLTTSERINDIMGELEEITFKSKRILDRVEQRIIEGNLFKVF
jgi:ABC-type transporter Mla subunit MlaD